MLNQKIQKIFKKFQRSNIDPMELEMGKTLAGTLGEMTDDFRLMISMVEDVISGRYEISILDLTVFIGAIIYVISPLDGIPDFIPILGLIDDIAVVSFVISQYSQILQKYREFISEKNMEEDL